jgi:hypothetical protein
MFHTFKSIEELEKYVSQFNGSEAVIAQSIMMMTINTLNKLHQAEIIEEIAKRQFKHARGL